jgi:hypothetical protein
MKRVKKFLTLLKENLDVFNGNTKKAYEIKATLVQKYYNSRI